MWGLNVWTQTVFSSVTTREQHKLEMYESVHTSRDSKGFLNTLILQTAEQYRSIPLCGRSNQQVKDELWHSMWGLMSVFEFPLHNLRSCCCTNSFVSRQICNDFGGGHLQTVNDLMSESSRGFKTLQKLTFNSFKFHFNWTSSSEVFKSASWVAIHLDYKQNTVDVKAVRNHSYLKIHYNEIYL